MKPSQSRNILQHCAKRISVLAAMLAASVLAAQAQVVFSPAKNIANSPNFTSADQIAVDSRGNINTVWLDSGSPYCPCTFTAFFSRSSDGGASFSAPVVMSHAGSDARVSGIAVSSSGNIYVLWTDNSPGYYAEFFAGSADGGSTFSAPQLVSNAGGNAAGGKLVVDFGGNIDVSWLDNSLGYYTVFFRRSADGGVSFSAPINVSNNPLGALAPDLSIDSAGNIYLAWGAETTFVSNGMTARGPALFFSSSTDGGATFSSATDVSGFNGASAQIGYQVAANSMSNISLLWTLDFGNGVGFVEYSYSSDGGATFQRAPSPGNGCEFPPNPRMALDSAGAANVVMQSSCGNGSASVGYGRYEGGVQTAGTAWNVRGNTPNPRLVIDSSDNIDIFFGGNFTRSSDNGATFSALQNAPAVPDSISTDSTGSIYFVWVGATTSGNLNTFFSRSVALLPVKPGAADVTGGSSLTVTVSMNGPAPTGGAAVSLSSSDSSVSAPGTVTIPEGTTSATFTVATSPVAAKTTAVITAAFGGVTQTATITVEPPVLTSMTLNPSSTMGGSSSTGTVTLSGPAPTGGAVVALSSSNSSLATVPPRVTVPAGFTNATFIVNTSRQLCPKSATITASLNPVSQMANLAVIPFVNLPPQACSAIGRHRP